MSESRDLSLSDQEKNDTIQYYRPIEADYVIPSAAGPIKPLFYKPDHTGLQIVVQKYNRQHGIDIQLFEASQRIPEDGSSLSRRFRDFKAHFDFSQLKQKKRLGVILMHGQNHVVPILLFLEGNQKYIVILDSTSGCRSKGYWSISALFPDYTFLLNLGTRQHDGNSCFTDAAYLLKEALRQSLITGEKLFNRSVITDQVKETEKSQALVASVAMRRSPLMFAAKKPDNFYLFKMPAWLLKTAQRSVYIRNSEPDMNEIVHESGITLQQHMEKFKIPVIYLQSQLNQSISNHAHTFLISKSQEHKEIIDNHLRVGAVKQTWDFPSQVNELIEDYLPYKKT